MPCLLRTLAVKYLLARDRLTVRRPLHQIIEGISLRQAAGQSGFFRTVRALVPVSTIVRLLEWVSCQPRPPWFVNVRWQSLPTLARASQHTWRQDRVHGEVHADFMKTDRRMGEQWSAGLKYGLEQKWRQQTGAALLLKDGSRMAFQK